MIIFSDEKINNVIFKYIINIIILYRRIINDSRVYS